MTIEGPRLRILIANAHRLLRSKYRGKPLWAMVSDLTGHGSRNSADLCEYAGYKSTQDCGNRELEKALEVETP